MAEATITSSTSTPSLYNKCTLSGLFRAAVTSFMDDPTYLRTAPRVILARECATLFEDKHNELAISNLVESLGNKLSNIVEKSLGLNVHSNSKRKEKMWAAYYEFRSSELVRLWRNFTGDLMLPEKYNDPWLIQVISRLFLEKIVAAKHPLSSSSQSSNINMTIDEHSALRYAAGYVLLSLRRKYASDLSLVSWINQQTDAGNAFSTGSFTQFTKIWVEKVNRGGLFLVSDCVYEVFHVMEQVLRRFLSSIPDHQCLNKDIVITTLQEDTEIQFHWSMMTFDIDDKTAHDVLIEVIKLWITIRGHSYGSAIVEEYKRINGALKYKKSLRKEMKQQSNNSE